MLDLCSNTFIFTIDLDFTFFSLALAHANGDLMGKD